MDTNPPLTVAAVALLIYVSGIGVARSDLCPAPFLNGTLTVPDAPPLRLETSTHGAVTLTGPLGAVSGQASVTCQSGVFNGMLYGMSDGSLYRCRGHIDGSKFTGQCTNASVTGEISGSFERH